MSKQRQQQGSIRIDPDDLMDEQAINDVHAAVQRKGYRSLAAFAEAEGYSYQSVYRSLSRRRVPGKKYARVFSELIDEQLGHFQPADYQPA